MLHRKGSGDYVDLPWGVDRDPQLPKLNEVQFYRAILFDCLFSLENPGRIFTQYGRGGGGRRTPDIQWLKRRVQEDIDWILGRGEPVVPFVKCCSIAGVDSDWLVLRLKKNGWLSTHGIENRVWRNGMKGVRPAVATGSHGKKRRRGVW